MTTKRAPLDNLHPGLCLFGDSGTPPDTGGMVCYSPLQLSPTHDFSGDGIPDTGDGPLYNLWAPARHNGSANYVFVDGHAAPKTFLQWQTSLHNKGFLYNDFR